MQRYVTKSFDWMHDGKCLSLEVMILFDPEFDTVSKIESIQVVQSDYRQKGETIEFRNTEHVGDITAIIVSGFPGMIEDIKQMEWKEAYKKTVELQNAENPEAKDVIPPIK